MRNPRRGMSDLIQSDEPRRKRGRAASVKGFGCRPMVTYPGALRAGVRKPPRKEPAGRRVDGCRLWGFDGAAAWVGDALAGVVGGGPTIAVANLSLPLRSAGRYWLDRRCSKCLRRHRGGREATPKARLRGRREAG